jgi:magnesium-transporting ATPase (P-type)
MIAFFDALTLIEKIFLISTLGSSALLLIRAVVRVVREGFRRKQGQAVGLQENFSEKSAPTGTWELTFQDLLSFLMMFGLFGLTLYQLLGIGETGSLLGALIVGAAAFWLVSRISTGG